MIKIQVIIGSTRQGRFGDKPAKWIFGKLKEKEGVEAELIDLRDWPLPFFDEPVSPSMMEGQKADYVSSTGKKWAKKVGEADGFLIVTPEYNHGYSAVLKNALDYVYKEWNNKPVAFMSYGGIAGGTRAVQQLRLVAIELQMIPIRAGVHIPLYWNQLDEKGELKEDSIKGTTETMLTQLIKWVKDLKSIRSKA